MGLLDVLAKGPADEKRVLASMLFYGRESFHVEHHPRSRVKQWMPWLEAGRFGIVALGYARPGEFESELVKRLDQFAWQGVRKALRSRVDVDFRFDVDVAFILECKTAAGSQESVSKQPNPTEAARLLARRLEQAESATTPWEDQVLLMFAQVLKTWKFNNGLESAIEGERNSDGTMPEAMAPELLSRYEKARTSAVEEFGLLRSEDLARAIHSTAENVSLVASKWRRKGEIFAVNYGGKLGYFAFQLDPMTGRPKPAIAAIIDAFPANTDGWRLALWLTSASPRLANRRPVDVLDKDPDKVIEAAKAENRVELF